MRRSYDLDGLRVARARMELVGGNGRPVTQGRFAHLVGVHPVTMSRIESNKARVSLEVLESIARVTGKSREFLLGDEEDATLELENRRRQRLAEAFEGVIDALLEVDAIVSQRPALAELEAGVEVVR